MNIRSRGNRDGIFAILWPERQRATFVVHFQIYTSILNNYQSYFPDSLFTVHIMMN